MIVIAWSQLCFTFCSKQQTQQLNKSSIPDEYVLLQKKMYDPTLSCVCSESNSGTGNELLIPHLNTINSAQLTL